MDDETLKREFVAEMVGGHVNMDKVTLSLDGFGLEIYTPEDSAFETMAVIILALPGDRYAIATTVFRGLVQSVLDAAQGLGMLAVFDPKNN